MSPPPDPERYLLPGGQPRSVVVPARIAGFLNRQALDRLRVQVRGADRELDEVLGALLIAGHEYGQAASAAVNGSAAVPRIADRSASGRGDQRPYLDTPAVAERLGCKPRNVRDLAQRGRLHGECVGGRWRFSPEVVDGYLADREQAS